MTYKKTFLYLLHIKKMYVKLKFYCLTIIKFNDS